VPGRMTPMNLNSASEGELTQLPRIGADRARKIVRYRRSRKGFRDWDDFAKTVGLTDMDVAAIRSRAWIGPPSKQKTDDPVKGHQPRRHGWSKARQHRRSAS
jgi:hypothetical protein